MASLNGIGGYNATLDFIIKTPTGDSVTRNIDRTESCTSLDHFLLMFPPKQLNLMVELTNKQLDKATVKRRTGGEMLKFFGLCLLITHFEFGNRASLWSTTEMWKCIPAPRLGDSGMSWDRFDSLWRYVSYSDQPEERPEGMSHEQ